MARSIHDTWGELHEAWHSHWSDPDIRDATIAELQANIRRQGAVRTRERRLRRQGPGPQPVDVERLPIFVEDEAPYVFHAIGEDDVREVLRRLPPGSLDGLQAIRLMVDRGAGDSSWPRDPFTGRHRFELLPGVYVSSVLGWYKLSSATVCIHGFLCEPEAAAPFVAWLRLRALRTLLHELAHHFDDTFRIGRSHWDLVDGDKAEAWANRRGGRDNDLLVLEYLRERYPDECERLQTWFETALGVELPPVMVVLENDVLQLSPAFRRLVRAVHAGSDLVEARVTFARLAHRAGLNEVASAIVDAVLAEDPAHPRALALGGCLAVCCERDYEHCLARCGLALEHDPGCLEALETMVRCQAIRECWPETAAACERALSSLPVDEEVYSPYILRTLVETRMLLGDAAGVRSGLARIRACATETLPLEADVYEVVERCWREQWEEAFILASRMLVSARYDSFGWGKPALVAARFECGRHLGRSVPELDPSILEVLDARAFTRGWAARLRTASGGA